MVDKTKSNFMLRKLKQAGVVVAAVLLISLFPATTIVSSAQANGAPEDSLWPIMIQKSPNDPRFSEQISLNQIQIPSAWDVTTGNSELIVAIIDTGVNPDHEELQSRVWINNDEIPNNGRDDDNNGYIDDYQGYNFMNNAPDILDQNGHGTGVASIIAANTNNSKGMSGINWNCKLMVLKALNSAGGGEYSDVSKALRYAADNGARVINMSFGTYFDSTELKAAVDYALSKNVVIVAAAGNNNQNPLLYPAAYPTVIAVGAVDSSGQRASFSNYGNNLDMVAPGINILMANYVGTNAYAFGSGTSFAAAHISGIASLIISRNPSLSPSQVENILKSTATGYANAADYGSGLVNAAAALGSLQITDHITAKITPTPSSAPADGTTMVRLVVHVTNNDFPLSNHQIRAYVTGSTIIKGETVDKRDILVGTTDNFGMVSLDLASLLPGQKLLVFSDATAGASLGDIIVTFNPIGGAPKYNAVWVDQNRPGVVKPEERITLWVDLKNTGNMPWVGKDSAITGQFRLGTAHSRDRVSQFYDSSWLSANRVATLQQDLVAPGSVGRFTFTVQAPMQSGTYKEYFNPVVEYVGWISDMGIYWELNVAESGIDPVAAHYDAEFVYKSADVILSPGQTADLQCEVRNIGTAKWVDMRTSLYGAVKLGTVNPYDRSSIFQASNWFSDNRVTDTGFVVEPGARLSLTFTIKAPLQPGVYAENFRLVSEYVTWFGPAIGWKITVQ
ncbi:MAG: S8 family serine peptidase [Patescibacteria group bacterium]